jgi:hypothetical protein
MLLAALLLPTLAAAESGVLTSGQAATGASTTTVTLRPGAEVFCAEYIISAGTATIQLENRLENGTNYDVVSGSALSANGVRCVTDKPVGTFRSNVTACGSCTVTVRYQTERPR